VGKKNLADNERSAFDLHTLKLQALMHDAGISSFKQLARLTGTSDRTLRKLRSGELDTLRWQTLVKISDALKIDIGKTIEIFGSISICSNNDRKIQSIEREYQLLQQQLSQQRETLQAEFQHQSLQTLESFLTYLPAAKYAASNNPNFPASKIFPLLQPVDRLIQQWGVTTIGDIGAQIAYDPQAHQLIEGSANPGELVTVRFSGYLQGDKLIFRAKVSPVIQQ
jgi:DNA-binding Xre family transcriptional regulator